MTDEDRPTLLAALLRGVVEGGVSVEDALLTLESWPASAFRQRHVEDAYHALLSYAASAERREGDSAFASAQKVGLLRFVEKLPSDPDSR